MCGPKRLKENWETTSIATWSCHGNKVSKVLRVENAVNGENGQRCQIQEKKGLKKKKRDFSHVVVGWSLTRSGETACRSRPAVCECNGRNCIVARGTHLGLSDFYCWFLLGWKRCKHVYLLRGKFQKRKILQLEKITEIVKSQEKEKQWNQYSNSWWI